MQITIDRRISFSSRTAGQLYWRDMTTDQREAVLDTLAAYVARHASGVDIYPDAIQQGYDEFALSFCATGGVDLIGAGKAPRVQPGGRLGPSGFRDGGAGLIGEHHHDDHGVPVYRLTREPAVRLVLEAPADRIEMLDWTLDSASENIPTTVLLGTDVYQLVVPPNRDIRGHEGNQVVVAAARAAGCLPALERAVSEALAHVVSLPPRPRLRQPSAPPPCWDASAYQPSRTAVLGSRTAESEGPFALVFADGERRSSSAGHYYYVVFCEDDIGRAFRVEEADHEVYLGGFPRSTVACGRSAPHAAVNGDKLVLTSSGHERSFAEFDLLHRLLTVTACDHIADQSLAID